MERLDGGVETDGAHHRHVQHRLDYRSEMLSLTVRITALHAQTSRDSLVLAAT